MKKEITSYVVSTNFVTKMSIITETYGRRSNSKLPTQSITKDPLFNVFGLSDFLVHI